MRQDNQKNITQLNNVISTDTSYSNQPENTLRFAMCAVTETKEGDLGFTSNEKGTNICVSIPEGYLIVGHIPLLNDEVILFLATENGPSIIAKQTNKCTLEILIKSTCLSFSQFRHIKGKWRLLNGCDIVIYFVDGNNTDKSLNLGNLSFYTNIKNNITGEKYTVDEANLLDQWNCGLMKLESDFQFPIINLEKVLSIGGSLKLGTYQFCINYSDGNQDLSSYTNPTEIIPITSMLQEPTSSELYNQIEGGDPTLDSATTNSIILNIDNLDLNYPYFNLIVIETISGVSIPYKVVTLPTQSILLQYTYRGISSSSIPLTMDDISIDKVTYQSSESIEIADNRLFRANLKDKDIKWGLFQRKANEIQSKYFTTSTVWSKEFVEYSGAKDANVYFDRKSYMRDEVYAFGIVWIFKDGSKSPVFHIPGREKNKFTNGVIIPYTTDPNIHNRYTQLSGGDWDSSTNIDPHDALSLINNTERHQVYNTAIRTYGSNTPNTGLYDTNIVQSEGELAYFESELNYPDSTCVDGQRIYPEGKIRFHKMPDTTLEPHFNKWFVNEFGGYDDFFTLQLGMKFENIIPPVEYENDIQGFIIVRAQRDESNKTILDKGLIYNNIRFYHVFGENTFPYQESITSNDMQGVFSTSSLQVRGEPFYTQSCLGNRHTIYSIAADNEYNNNGKYYGNYYGEDSGAYMPLGFSENNGIKYSSQFYDNFNLSFYSPKVKFETNSLNAGYLKVENKAVGSYFGTQAVRETKRLSHLLIDYKLSIVDNTFKTNYSLINQNYIDPAVSFNTGSYNFSNVNQQETYIINTREENPVPHLTDTLEHTIVDFLEGGAQDGYPPQQTNICLYGSLKKENPTIYGAIENINYIAASNFTPYASSINVYGGDCYISRFGFLRTYVTYRNNNNVSDNETLWKQLPYFFVESEINTELRHEFRDSAKTDVDTYYPCTTYYPKEEFYNFIRNWEFQRLALDYDNANKDEINDLIQTYPDNSYCKNFYQYNYDYSKENNIKYYFPLPLSIKPCSNCNNHYPHRIVFSQQGYQEQSIDYFKNYLSNSYDDIEGDQGVIIDIWKFNNYFCIHTEQSLIIKNIQAQNLTTDQGNSVNLGKNDVLSSPSMQVRNNPLGYAGTQHKQALSISELGAFFPDAKAGKVFLFQQGIEEISKQGNKNFFENNLSIEFLNQFERLTNTKYPNEGTTSDLSVGLISSYDTRHERYLLCKKDYKIINNTLLVNNSISIQNLNEDIENGNVTFNTLIYNPNINFFFIVTGNTNQYNIETITFDNKQYFENLSWTYSYDTILKGWKSFHPYLPNYIYNTQSRLFSFKQNNVNIWEHNIGEFQTFYGIKYPFIVENILPINQITTNTTAAIHYLSNVLEYDNINMDWKEINFDTFNKGLFYNSTQSSGLLDLKIKNNDLYSSLNTLPSELLVNKREKNWSINEFRNNVIDESEALFTKNWNDIQNDYFIDKLPNQNIIDYNKSLYDKDKLRDKYLVTRFFYDNPNNRKFTYKFIVDKTKVSYS